MFRLITFIFYIFFYLPVAFASDSRETDIQCVQQYLKSLKSVAIDFTQEDSRGNESTGKLIIVKPKRFLCNYYPPYPLIIVGNTSYVSIYDYEMEQLSRINVDENVFNFLLTDDGTMGNNFEITNVMSNDSEIALELVYPEFAKKTVITFDKKIQRLQSIVNYEPDGNVISINITNIAHITNVDPKLFVLQNPEIYGKKPRLNQCDIEKKYRVR